MSNHQKITLIGENTRPEKRDRPKRGDIIASKHPDGTVTRYRYLGIGSKEHREEIEELRAAQVTVCIDFDGVIHSYTSPWVNEYVIPDPPVKGAIDFLRSCINWPMIIPIIYSARSQHPQGIKAMQNWFMKHGLRLEELAHIKFARQKPPANMYIDDRGWTFTGTFPTYDEMMTFDSWVNKKTTL